jgi:hypothetical protein
MRKIKMELVGIELTKIIQLFYINNTKAHRPRTEIVAALVERYSFAAAPASIEDLTSNKFVFSLGRFRNSGIDRLEIFPDGIVVAARIPSEELDAFIDDLFLWSHEAFGMEKITTHTIEKIYESHLLVRFEGNVFSFLNALSDVQSELQNKLFETSGIETKFEQYGFTLAADNSLLGSLKPTFFRLERKLDIPFASDLYFSAAPLKTVDHTSLLEKIGALA